MKCEHCGGWLMECERCKKVIPREAPRQRYCHHCAVEVVMERNREHCKQRYERHKERVAKGES